MRQTFLIAYRELKQRLKQRSFWLSALGVPLFLIVVWGASGMLGGDGGTFAPEAPTLSEESADSESEKPVGIVDQADLIEVIPSAIPAGYFNLYPSTEAADSALSDGQIDAYFVVPPGYREDGRVERISSQLPTGPVDTPILDWVLISNLAPDADEMALRRLRYPLYGGPQQVTISAEGEQGASGDSMLPFLVAMIVMLPLFTSGGYLFQSVIKEKESRMLEILLISLNPRQLLTGKLLGLGTLSLVQYFAWLGISLGALVVTGSSPDSFLSSISLSIDEIALIVPYALGGFALYAGLMAGVGALAPDMESSRAWVFVITLPMLIPIYLATAISTAPNGPLATGLSLFPFSAPVSMLIRMTSTRVPGWQVGLSIALLLAAAVGIIWLMARLFRAQTLLSGEELSIRRFIAALAGA